MTASRIVGCLVVSLAMIGPLGGLLGGPLGGTTVGTRTAAAQGKPAEPAELLMSVGVGPDSTLDSLRAYANAIQPGAGVMLTVPMLRKQITGMVTATSLDGLDDKGTLYVLAVDGGPALKGTVVVGKIADEARLQQGAAPAHLVKKNGWAVIGPKPVAEKVAPFALGTLSAQPISGPPIATIYTKNLMVRYKTEIADARTKLLGGLGAAGGQMSGFIQSYFDGLLSALSDSDRVIVTFDATKDIAAVDLALVPKAGTRLAKLVALQQPADYALVGKLPASQAPVLVAGRLEAGPYRAGILEAMSQIYGPGTPAGMTAALGAIFKAATGEFAMGMQMMGGKGMEVTQLFGLADGKAADKAISQLLDAIKKPQTVTTMGMTVTHTANPKTTTHDGVTVRGYDVTYDLSKAAPESKAMMERMIPKTGLTGRIATFEQLGAVAVSADGNAGVAAAIDAVRNKGKRYAPPAQVTDFLAGSRMRKESVAMVMDVGGLLGMGPAGRALMLSMGFADKRAHLRITLPAATIRGFASGGMP
jgi:hypothetical protein